MTMLTFFLTVGGWAQHRSLQYQFRVLRKKCGVPQGSILGPLLFLLNMNNLCNVSKVVDFILFADDTNIFFSHKDFNLLPEILNSEMLKLTTERKNRWTCALELSPLFLVFLPFDFQNGGGLIRI